MQTRSRWANRLSVSVMVGILGSGLALEADAPRGWLLAGTKPASYDVEVDKEQIYQAHASAYLKSLDQHVDGFGTLMQSISAGKYLGSKIRLSGLVKPEEVMGWAGLWMRVDRGNTMVSFDNMQNRAIKGTTGWQRYDVVLDVPKDATRIAFGILLDGAGEVWLNSVKLEAVRPDAPTDVNEGNLPDKPVNLEFTTD